MLILTGDISGLHITTEVLCMISVWPIIPQYSVILVNHEAETKKYPNEL